MLAKFITFLFCLTLPINLSFALDIFEPLPPGDLETRFHVFKNMLRENREGKSSTTDEEEIVSQMVKDPRNNGVSKSVLFIQYLRKLAIQTTEGQAAAPYYSRMIMAALGGAHCGGINTKKIATDQEREIMKAGAQKVGELIAPWLVILGANSRKNFDCKDSEYWKPLAPTDNVEVKRHFNIVAVIVQSTAFSNLNLFRQYHEPQYDGLRKWMSPLISKYAPKFEVVEEPAMLDILDEFKENKRIGWGCLPYEGISDPREFDRYISSDSDIKFSSAKAVIAWMAFLRENADKVDIEAEILPFEDALIRSCFSKFKHIDDKICKLLKFFTNSENDESWERLSTEEKIKIIKTLFVYFKRVVRPQIFERPKPQQQRFKVQKVKDRLKRQLAFSMEVLLSVDRFRSFIAEVFLGLESTTFTIPDGHIDELFNYLFAHTNLSPEEFERLLSFVLLPFHALAAQNPLFYNNSLETVCDYFIKNIGESGNNAEVVNAEVDAAEVDFDAEVVNAEVDAEVSILLSSIDFLKAFKNLQGKNLRTARAQLLKFLQFAVTDYRVSQNNRFLALDQLRPFVRDAWVFNQDLEPALLDLFLDDRSSFYFPFYRLKGKRLTTFDGESFASYKKRIAKEERARKKAAH